MPLMVSAYTEKVTVPGNAGDFTTTYDADGNEERKYKIMISITDNTENHKVTQKTVKFTLGKAITSKEVDYGVAICGSGIGISIAMNKIKGVYCAKVNNSLEAQYTRLDNDTNCVAFSANTSLEEAILIVETFFKTDFSNLERHQRRIDKVKKIEEKLYD